MKTLAIFVPIYNIKSEYIEKCISSLRTARGYSTDFSVYIVDNASTNPEVNTTILKQIENTDFTHIRLRKNKGKPSAVRAAYKKITEDYIVTLDGDDWITGHKIVDLISDLKIEKPDYVVTSYTYFNNKTGKSKKRNIIPSKRRKDYYMLRKLPKYTWHFDPNTIISTKLLKENNFKLPENITAYEDVYIAFFSLSNVKKPMYWTSSFYNYRINQNGTNLSAPSQITKRLKSFEEMYFEMMPFNFSNKVAKRNMTWHVFLSLFAITFFSLEANKKWFLTPVLFKYLNRVRKDNKKLYRRIMRSWLQLLMMLGIFLMDILLISKLSSKIVSFTK